MLRPFDIVKTTREDKKYYGMITETDGREACVEWFDEDNVWLENAWWDAKELTVVNNVISIIGNAMADACGVNTNQGDKLIRRKIHNE